jgi:molecular chaperone GrpE
MANQDHQTPKDEREPLQTPADDTVELGAEAAPAAEAAAADAGGAPPVGPANDTTVATLQTQLAEAQNRCLRAQAELDNFRKRTLRTAEEERRYASLPLLRDLLPVVDNLQRAIRAAEQHENAGALLAGVKLVAEQLNAALERHHCVPIAAEGAAFDPHLHQAIAQQPSAEHAPGHVALVAQTGYQLHDRVIRPAQVIVAAPPPEASDAEGETSSPRSSET